jgi:hypothetical protein
VSVVEAAELAAVPKGRFAHGRVTGPTGAYLLAIVRGTAVGLALAHWFAFRVAAPAFRGERPTRVDTQNGLAQLAGAGLVTPPRVAQAWSFVLGASGPGCWCSSSRSTTRSAQWSPRQEVSR